MNSISQHEQRTHERIGYRTKLQVYQYYNMNGILIKPKEPIEMEVFDISLGGIGVISYKDIPGHATLEFTLYLEEIPYQVMAKIAWTQHNLVFFRYGLEIIGHNNMLFRHLQKFVNNESLFET